MQEAAQIYEKDHTVPMQNMLPRPVPGFCAAYLDDQLATSNVIGCNYAQGTEGLLVWNTDSPHLQGAAGAEEALEGAPHRGRPPQAVQEQVVVEDAGRARVRENVHVALHQVVPREGPVPLRRACAQPAISTSVRPVPLAGWSGAQASRAASSLTQICARIRAYSTCISAAQGLGACRLLAHRCHGCR